MDEAIAYLDGLSGETRSHARDYICRVPAQLDTPYRRAIKEVLGW
ncbi:acyl-ACP desaturase [Enterobacter hormaechei]|nr:acyl-ACP desaturase [Enterobacter hormaechei]